MLPVTLPVGLGLMRFVVDAAAKAETAHVVQRFYDALEEGDVEKAVALSNLDLDDVACPELFTNDVYSRVTRRPLDVHVYGSSTGESREEGARARTHVSSQRSGYPGTYSIVRDVVRDASGSWRVDVTSEPLYLVGGVGGAESANATGLVSIQGQCPHVYSSETEVQVFPGQYIVTSADPATGQDNANPLHLQVWDEQAFRRAEIDFST